MTKWPKWVIDAHDRQYVDDLLTANYWDRRIALKPRDPKKEPGTPIGDAEVAELRASNPKFAGWPDAALKKLYRRRGG